MGLDYVLKDPLYYPLEVKRRCGVTHKKPFSRFEIVGLGLVVLSGFFFTFLSVQNKSIMSFIFVGRLHALKFFSKGV